MNDREIIKQLVAKAKEAEGIFYDSVDGTEKVAADFTSMNDAEIAKFLDSHGMDVRDARFFGIEQYWQDLSQKIIDNVTYDTPDHYTEKSDWDGWIRESKKYSSFNDQQTITENFRRYISEIRVEDQLGTKPNTLELTPDKITAALGLEGEKAKGYTTALKHVGRYKFDQINRKGDRMAPREWNEGWKQALSDVEEWSKSDKKQSFMNWLMSNRSNKA